MRADAECMVVGLEVLRALEVHGAIMRVNNRRILDGALDAVGVEGKEPRHAVLRAIDKLPKIGRAGVEAEIRASVGLDDERLARLFAVITRDVGGAADLEGLRPLVGASADGARGIDELTELLGILERGGYGDRIAVDLSIARGLDYYTSTIYETFLVGHEEYGSVMSGGRYDTLLGMFLKESLPAVGISLGVDRLIAALLELGLVTPRKVAADVFIALFEASDYGANMQLARALRVHGLRSELALSPDKLGKQFKLAERKGYRHVLLAGADEHARGVVHVKELGTGAQVTRAVADAAEWVPELAG